MCNYLELFNLLCHNLSWKINRKRNHRKIYYISFYKMAIYVKIYISTYEQHAHLHMFRQLSFTIHHIYATLNINACHKTWSCFVGWLRVWNGSLAAVIFFAELFETFCSVGDKDDDVNEAARDKEWSCCYLLTAALHLI